MIAEKRRALVIALGCACGFLASAAAAAFVIAPWIHGPNCGRLVASGFVVLVVAFAFGVAAICVWEEQ